MVLETHQKAKTGVIMAVQKQGCLPGVFGGEKAGG